MLTFPSIERTDTMELPVVGIISGLAAAFITPFWPWIGFVVIIPAGLIATYWLVTEVRNQCARLLWAYSFPKRISARKLQTLLAHDPHRYVLHIQYNSGGFDCTQEKPAAVLEDKVASTLIAIHPPSWRVNEVCEKAGVLITKH